MYLKPQTAVTDWSAVLQFLADHPLGLLTTSIPVAGQSTIQASHLPFHYIPPSTPPPVAESTTESSHSITGTWNSASAASSSSSCSSEETIDLGRLQCHIARSNPQAKALLSLESSPSEVLIVFSSPLNQHGYISPSWYTTTKPATGKTVPTWNYAELQIYGTIRPTPVQPIVRNLSITHESKLQHKIGKTPWAVEEAPERYIALLEKAIVGMEVTVTKVGMKMKMSREKVEGDREGVMAGLRSVEQAGEEAVADLVERLGPFKKP